MNEDNKITFLVTSYGLACIFGGYWAGTQNFYAFWLSILYTGYCFYQLTK